MRASTFPGFNLLPCVCGKTQSRRHSAGDRLDDIHDEAQDATRGCCRPPWTQRIVLVACTDPPATGIACLAAHSPPHLPLHALTDAASGSQCHTRLRTERAFVPNKKRGARGPSQLVGLENLCAGGSRTASAAERCGVRGSRAHRRRRSGLGLGRTSGRREDRQPREVPSREGRLHLAVAGRLHGQWLAESHSESPCPCPAHPSPAARLALPLLPEFLLLRAFEFSRRLPL
ncbi:hypothetical protein B0H15DRAFT_376212 [Mycena belliarum]|uniref:Uncharacterized protein n=1 Tax=Mycena belliarum TaxID=1033014 RepID=A0AAD6XPL4_9AGAR|nr:hypothetical protein B0H15DRAFT_376212 [Mycena belliae]